MVSSLLVIQVLVIVSSIQNQPLHRIAFKPHVTAMRSWRQPLTHVNPGCQRSRFTRSARLVVDRTSLEPTCLVPQAPESFLSSPHHPKPNRARGNAQTALMMAPLPFSRKPTIPNQATESHSIAWLPTETDPLVSLPNMSIGNLGTLRPTCVCDPCLKLFPPEHPEGQATPLCLPLPPCHSPCDPPSPRRLMIHGVLSPCTCHLSHPRRLARESHNPGLSLVRSLLSCYPSRLAWSFVLSLIRHLQSIWRTKSHSLPRRTNSFSPVISLPHFPFFTSISFLPRDGEEQKEGRPLCLHFPFFIRFSTPFTLTGGQILIYRSTTHCHGILAVDSLLWSTSTIANDFSQPDSRCSGSSD